MFSFEGCTWHEHCLRVTLVHRIEIQFASFNNSNNHILLDQLCHESATWLFSCFLFKVIYALLCYITVHQEARTLYHRVTMSVSTNTWDSLTNVRNPPIKMLLQWEMALTARNRAQMQSVFHTEVSSGAHCQYFIHPASPLSRQDVTMAVLTRCLSRKLWKLIFIVSHIRAIDGQWVCRVL